jgi:hypothetical protein
MNKRLLLNFALKSFPLFIIIAVIASFPFLGTQCSEFINGETLTQTDFYATWALQRQTGQLIDICPGERVKYGSDNNASLTCPPYTDTLRRAYQIDLNQKILTYTATQVSYRYTLKDSAGGKCLNLYGINVNRNLFYQKLPANLNSDIGSIKNGASLNSSEFIKK